jgi:hypothetical protein
MQTEAPSRPGTALRPGDLVEVQNRLDGTWSPGFEVVEAFSGVGQTRYRVRRLSDGVILPYLLTAVTSDRSR